MLDERRCGLKYWDRVVAAVGKEAVLDRTLAIMLQFPNTWGYGWNNAHWAIGNAVRELLGTRGDIAMTWNIHDVLTPEEIRLFAARAGILAEDYLPSWPRPEGTPREEPPREPARTLYDRLDDDL